MEKCQGRDALMTNPPPLPRFDETIARASIPETMQHPRSRRWFSYRIWWKKDADGNWKLDKRPFCVVYSPSGKNYTWVQKEGWCTFPELCEKIRESDKIQDTAKTTMVFRVWPGYPIVEDSRLIFIDLDHCFLPDGTLTETAQRYVDKTKSFSYIERSVSGNGLHIFTWYSGKRKFPMNPEPGVETYTNGRGALITGNVYNG